MSGEDHKTRTNEPSQNGAPDRAALCEILRGAFAGEGFALTARQLEQFAVYFELLLEWNQKMNLTAIEDPVDAAYKHFVDSALLLRAVPEIGGKKLIDIGTGAGFPGVPVKILEPTVALTLFDSLQKRIVFLQALCAALQLPDVQTIHGRAEEFARKAEHRERYDLVTARAVARLPVLLELCLPFVKKGGLLIAMKGPELAQELAESEKALRLLGGRVRDVQTFKLRGGQYTRNLAIIEKTGATPKAYPRKAGTPQKKPL